MNLRLRHVAWVNPPTTGFEQIPSGTAITFMPLEAVWSGGKADVSRTRHIDEVATGYVRFMAGDVLCPKVTPTFQAGRSMVVPSIEGGVGAATTEVHVVRPRPGLADARYLMYRLLASDFLDEGVSRFQGVAGLQRVPADFLSNLTMPSFSLEEQRRIADFLDDQTARIDTAIQASRDEVQLLETVAQAGFSEVVASYSGPNGSSESDWRTAKLGHLLRQFTNGYVGPTRDILVQSGVPYIQSLHIKDGRIDFERKPYFVTQEWHDERPRIHLRHGDVVIVQTGDIGSVAVVPEGFGEASCHALIICRPHHGIVSSEYLGEYLRSPAGQSELLRRATGALHPHLESGIKDAHVPVPPLHQQAEIVSEVTRIRMNVAESQRLIETRLALLEERKRSLITAAVTGQLDVSTARPLSMSGWVPGVAHEAPAVACTSVPARGVSL